MDLFFEPHRIMLKSLLDGEVDFIMIGGYAVNFHGFSRPTGDLDLWLKPTEENKNKLLAVLEKNGFEKSSIEYVKSLDFSNAEVFCVGKVPIRVDFLTRISGVDYEDAENKKMIAEVEDMQIPVLHLEHLVLSKISNDRTKDKMDLEELQKIANMKKNKKSD
jgi:hypothetical protein